MAAPFVSDPQQPVRESYFKQFSEKSANPADDNGHIPQLESNGKLHPFFSSAWSLIEEITVPGNTNQVVLDNIPAYHQIMLVVDGLVCSGNNILLEVSEDNGATWLTTNKYAEGNGRAILSNIFMISCPVNTSPHYACVHIFGADSTYVKPYTVNNGNGVIVSTQPIDAVKVRSTSDNITAGTIRLFAV